MSPHGHFLLPNIHYRSKFQISFFTSPHAFPFPRPPTLLLLNISSCSLTSPLPTTSLFVLFYLSSSLSLSPPSTLIILSDLFFSLMTFSTFSFFPSHLHHSFSSLLYSSLSSSYLQLQFSSSITSYPSPPSTLIIVPHSNLSSISYLFSPLFSSSCLSSSFLTSAPPSSPLLLFLPHPFLFSHIPLNGILG